MEALRIIKEKCIECPVCQRECRFLKNYDTPKTIADHFNPAEKKYQSLPFECSLCGLCAAVCPVGLDPARMFQEMRQEAVRIGMGEFPEHMALLNYEKRGTSKRYTWYAFPRGCDTILFPGCALPGTRPEIVSRLYEHLKKRITNIGLVLDCCTKPSRDLGRQTYFQTMFGEMTAYLLEHGIRTVLVACPNCYRVFKENGRELKIKSIYEVLAEKGLPETENVSSIITIHDPCVVRFDESIQVAVRKLAQSKGLSIDEMPHNRQTTLCCGEGGAVGFLSPEMAKIWASLRKEEAQGRRMITSCAGCVTNLNKITPTIHILDILFEPKADFNGKIKPSPSPITYWNRIRLKRRFQKIIPAAVSRERVFQGEEKKSPRNLYRRIAVLLFIIGSIISLNVLGVSQYFEQETLKKWIQESRMLAPLVYMFLYSMAPLLFLPGLPLTIVGGLLFGPFWGVIYTIFSATLGACLAFLMSRYLTRDWLEGKLRSPRWKRLDEQVESQGWKVVLFTRLIPLFPFNLLNYAFGLTKIKFSHYALATFWGMLPACIAFIVFSSSFWDLIQGRVSSTFLIGLVLVVFVLLLPLFYRAYRYKKK